MSSGVIPHTVNGSDRLTEDQVRAYLGHGYAAEADRVIGNALKFPNIYMYTDDRHRYVVRQMPGGEWMAGDCTASEERIKALARQRRGDRSHLRFMGTGQV